MTDETNPVAPAQLQRLPGALLSLVVGVLTYFALGPFGAIPAVLAGHSAMSRYNRSPEMYYGERMAKAGLILGYIGIALSVIALILSMMITHGKPNAPFIHTLF